MAQPTADPRVDDEPAPIGQEREGESEAAAPVPLVRPAPVAAKVVEPEPPENGADATLVDPEPPASESESVSVAESASASESASDADPDADPSANPSVEEPDAPPAPAAALDVPRYRIDVDETRRFIVSGNAPNIRLEVVRGMSVAGKSSRSFDDQTIFLDGVYSGPPFLNNEARHYSLDHHAGCVRAFTLATCEQAVVMLLQGLPLASGMWTLYVNDPDLDSMLAAWVLMNHVELLSDDKQLLRAVMPVIRLEGVIDAHGTEREILTGFPEEMHEATKARVDALMEGEREIKTSGGWASLDFVSYAQEALERIDEELVPAEVRQELMRTQEAGRAALANGRIGVLIESSEGIYEVEARLKQRYGADLGVIVLKIGVDRYTLRLCDAFLRRDLTAIFKALNRVDPKAGPGNAWGGSGDIGGSPRADGTGLTGAQILEVMESVLGEQPPWYAKLWNSIRALFAPKTTKKLPRG